MQAASEPKTLERPRNRSLEIFDTNQFLSASLQVKLIFGTFSKIFLILGYCRSSPTLTLG